MTEPSAPSFHSDDPEVFERDGAAFAHQAVQNDQAGQFETAAFYYNEAAQSLLTAALNGSQLPNITERARQYILRCEELKKIASQQTAKSGQQKTAHQLELEKAKFLMNQALDDDSAGNIEDAVSQYSEAVEVCLKIKHSTKDKSLEERVVKLATQALDRAEVLKRKISPTTKAPPNNPLNKPTQGGKVVPPLGFGAFLDDSDEEKDARNRVPVGPAGPSGPQVPTGLANIGPKGYSKEEIDVLRKTSDVNGRQYVPFMAQDVKEKFAFPVAFSDRDGKLALSPKQKQRFARWVRPEDYCENPQMIYAISSFSIRQTVVSDCSFVASMAISAQYERRFKQKLITRIIYPQNRNGDPVYNPCGKYMVKLNINGVQRKVIIDDYLPMSQHGELLCSFSNNKNELWVSLMEKAYMKVMGGYDFPGSNSNIDLHALTGWIPERVSISTKGDDERFNKDKEFKRILDRFHRGHCLVTLATGEIPEAEADRAGLVPTHAYAMLDIREVKGKRLFMLKNPWNHLRWKGRFSENDLGNWTPDLQKELNYDPKSAQTYDNGVFWIDYESLLHFYDVIYINWNPDLFKYTTCIHNSWLAKEGPRKDRYNISDNPQYRLELKSNQPTAAVWCLLTRHITDKDDFADNREFIALLVYDTGGKKVFYPYDPPPYKDGVRINSPHYLCKLLENKKNATYTLVMSQYEKNNSIHYTLRVYATCEFSLTKIADPYKKQYEKRLVSVTEETGLSLALLETLKAGIVASRPKCKITGQWKGVTAGGCGNYPETHKNNPIYQIKLDNSSTDNYILIELLGPKEYSVGVDVTAVSVNVPTAPGGFSSKSSGDFRRGYSVVQLDKISGGVYNLSPCTFRPGEEGPFFLDISSSVPMSIAQLR